MALLWSSVYEVLPLPNLVIVQRWHYANTTSTVLSLLSRTQGKLIYVTNMASWVLNLLLTIHVSAVTFLTMLTSCQNRRFSICFRSSFAFLIDFVFSDSPVVPWSDSSAVAWFVIYEQKHKKHVARDFNVIVRSDCDTKIFIHDIFITLLF